MVATNYQDHVQCEVRRDVSGMPIISVYCACRCLLLRPSFVSFFNHTNVVLTYQIFCLHGGLSPSIETLDHIRALDRVQEVGVVVAPRDEGLNDR